MGVAIPNRSLLKAQDVCDLAQVQPYVLRSWEAEFPDLGVSKTADGPRLYRRADVELVLRLRDLLFVDGLTLAGARRQLLEEGVTTATEREQAETITDEDVVALVDKQTRKGLHDVREGLGWILEVLEGGASSRSARPAKTVKSGKSKKAAFAPPALRRAKATRAPKARAAKGKVKAKPSRATAARRKR